jgi:hypothetical protein
MEGFSFSALYDEIKTQTSNLKVNFRQLIFEAFNFSITGRKKVIRNSSKNTFCQKNF